MQSSLVLSDCYSSIGDFENCMIKLISSISPLEYLEYIAVILRRDSWLGNCEVSTEPITSLHAEQGSFALKLLDSVICYSCNIRRRKGSSGETNSILYIIALSTIVSWAVCLRNETMCACTLGSVCVTVGH
jgi:hypothetical protein